MNCKRFSFQHFLYLQYWQTSIQHSVRNKCKCSIKTNTPHPPRDPPEDYNPTSFTHYSFELPENVHPLVFRPLKEKEHLGPGAAKDISYCYKNPEYYSYHRYSHVDLFMNSMRIRMERRIHETRNADKKRELDKYMSKERCQNDAPEQTTFKGNHENTRADCRDINELGNTENCDTGEQNDGSTCD